MKSVIREEVRKTSYPTLKKIANVEEYEEYVVLFTDPRTGVVVASNVRSPWHIGDHSIAWSEECFTPFEGTVTLSNG